MRLSHGSFHSYFKIITVIRSAQENTELDGCLILKVYPIALSIDDYCHVTSKFAQKNFQKKWKQIFKKKLKQIFKKNGNKFSKKIETNLQKNR